MTATDEPRIHSNPPLSRRARREVEEVSFDELMAGLEAEQDEAVTDDVAVPVAPASAGPAEPKSARTHANADAPAPDAARADRSPAADDEHHPKGRFYRPELYSTTQRITGSVVVKVTTVVLLLGGTGALVFLALDRFN